jgi:HSP20 family protein
MSIFRWGQGWDPLRDLEREVDRLFRHVNLTLPSLRLGRQYPPINLYELPGEFLITAELPGTQTEDLELTISGGILTIQGKRDDAAGVSDERFRRHERFRGAWQRSVAIPERVQEDKLSAELNHGVLKIHLPKAGSLQPRQIPVEERGD